MPKLLSHVFLYRCMSIRNEYCHIQLLCKDKFHTPLKTPILHGLAASCFISLQLKEKYLFGNFLCNHCINFLFWQKDCQKALWKTIGLMNNFQLSRWHLTTDSLKTALLNVYATLQFSGGLVRANFYICV